jgi:hypothetical protein
MGGINIIRREHEVDLENPVLISEILKGIDTYMPTIPNPFFGRIDVEKVQLKIKECVIHVIADALGVPR